MEGEFYDGQLTVLLTSIEARVVARALTRACDVDSLQDIADDVGDTDTTEVENTLLGLSDLLIDEDAA